MQITTVPIEIPGEILIYNVTQCRFNNICGTTPR